MAEQLYAIITAGGSGTRLKAEVPKQFLELGGRPVLAHSLQRFSEAFPEIRLLVTLPEKYQDYWEALCERYAIAISHTVITGGEERFHSIKKALDTIGQVNEGWVAIHDAVRPFPSTDLIRKGFEIAKTKGSAIPAVPLSSSIRQHQNPGWKAVDRTQFRLIQTPQVFHLGHLQNAYAIPYQPNFTDDAGVFEHAGHSIHLYEGEPQNFKITTNTDLEMARCLAGKHH